MNNYICARNISLLSLLLMTLSTYTTTVDAEQFEGSKTIIRGSTSLQEGAAALQAGRIEEGIHLTLEGLKTEPTVQDRSIGHSNACAGYVTLRRWADALVQCDAALALDTSNWHAYNNRAAIYIKQGLFELGYQDLQAGLALAPNAKLLHESMRILEKNRLLSGQQSQKAVTS